MAASLTLKDSAVVTPVSFSDTEAVFLVGTTTSLFHPYSRAIDFFPTYAMSNPEIFLFLHLPRVSLPSPALRPGFSSPLTLPFDLLHPPVTPFLCRLEKTPIRSDPSTHPSTSSTSNHSFNPLSYQEPPPPIPSVHLAPFTN